MERRKFEDYWKDAFNGAEISPSDNVWTNIELDLEKEKGSQLKRRLFYYQLVAAASVIFTLGIGVGVYIQDNNNYDKDRLVIKEEQSPQTKSNSNSISSFDPATDIAENKSALDSKPEITNQEKNEIESGVKSPSNDIQSTQLLNKRNSYNSNGLASASKAKHPRHNQAIIRDNSKINSVATADRITLSGEHHNYDAVFASETKRSLPVLVNINTAEKKNLYLNQEAEPEADPVALMLAKLEQREKEITKEEAVEKKSHNNKLENLWTSVGFAAGSFNSVNSETPSTSAFNHTASQADASTFADAAKQETKASGITYSMGVNVGTKLSQRWVFQGGVNYLTQSSDYKQQNLFANKEHTAFKPLALNDMRPKPEGEAAEPSNLVNTQPYNVNNSVRYMSIPVQAGYMVIDRSFGLQLNAGVATDVFLQNVIEATVAGEKVDPSKAGIGENTAFRPVNFNGLVGTELSYRFARHYRIALNPGLKYPFNSIYKSDDYKSTRLTVDIGLRFRYIFH